MARSIKTLSVVGFGFAAVLALSGCQHAPQAPAAEVALAGKPLFRGVAYSQISSTSPVAQSIHVLALDLTDPSLRLVVTAGDKSAGMEYRAQTTSQYLVGNRLQAAVNGGYFLPFKGGSKGGDDYYPKAGDPVNVSGAAIADGKEVSPVETALDPRVNAVICIKAGLLRVEDGQTCAEAVVFAMAAGPRLLKDKVATPFEANDPAYGKARHPRTALGVDASRKRAWLVVVDGRQPGLSEGATLDELTAIFVRLGASDAINLDGGGSTTMVIAGATGPQILNSPIHTGVPGRERPSANHLGLRAAPLR